MTASLATFRELIKGDKVRRTDDNMISAIDLIRGMTGKDANHSAQMFQRLTSAHPELIEDTHVFQFPGQGQRPTPVVDEETAVQIAMLLPNKYGADFRLDAVKHIPTQDLIDLLPEPLRSALSAEQNEPESDSTIPYFEPHQRQQGYPAVRLHGAALRVVPDLITWKEVNRLYLPDSYMSLYAKRREGVYPFTAYKIGRTVFYYAPEIEAWIEACCPTVEDGWSFPCPVPANLFKSIYDVERLGVMWP